MITAFVTTPQRAAYLAQQASGIQRADNVLVAVDIAVESATPQGKVAALPIAWE